MSGKRLSRNLLISSLESTNRFEQVSGTSDASKTQLGLIGSWEEILTEIQRQIIVTSKGGFVIVQYVARSGPAFP
jgi:hypothetical protein